MKMSHKKRFALMAFLLLGIAGTFSSIRFVNASSQVTIQAASGDSETFCNSSMINADTASASVVRSGDFCIITFTTASNLSTANLTWAAPAWVSTVDYLVVAGGGGGGAHVGGGGGGGGTIEGSKQISSSSIQIRIGGGGAGGHLFSPGCLNPSSGITGDEVTGTSFCNNSSRQSKARSGGASSFDSVEAQGGGNGGHWNYYYPGDGGSGGGAGGVIPRVATGISGQGFNGGAYGGPAYSPGGGGGAGGLGASGSPTLSISGAGGVGKSSSITGTSTLYGCGGGGGGHGSGDSTPAAAGCATAGAGQKAGTGFSATANFGGGGGGGGNGSGVASRGGDGGSGTVIVRYPIPPTPSLQAQNVTVLVDPRAESIRIPLIQMQSYFNNRSCINMANQSGTLDITDADAGEYKVELVGSSGASSTADDAKNLRLHGTSAQMNSVFAPSGEAKSFIQIRRPTTGQNTSFNETLTLSIKADNSSSTACTSAPGTTILTATIKPYELEVNQKNEISLN